MGQKISFSVVLKATAGGFVSSIKTARTTLSAYEKSVNRAARTNKSLALSFSTIGTAISGAAVASFGKAIFETAKQVDNIERSFKVLLGTSEQAGQKFDWLKLKGEELGLVYMGLADSYKNILASGQGSSLSEADIDKVFTSITVAASALGMSADDTQGSLRALGQMMSKDSIQAEELRGQLGERLPGAMQLMAQGIGVTSTELNNMMENGELKGEKLRQALLGLADVLDKKFSGVAGTGLQAEFNRLINDFAMLREEMARGGMLDVFIESIKELRKIINDPAMRQGFLNLIKDITDIGIATIKFVATNSDAVISLGKFLGAVLALKVVVGIFGTIASAAQGVVAAIKAFQLAIGAEAVAALGAFTAAAAPAVVALAAFGAISFGALKLYDVLQPDIKALNKLREELDATMKKYKEFAGFSPQSKSREDFLNNKIEDIIREKESLEKAYRYWSARVSDLYADSQETNIFGNPTKKALDAIEMLPRAKEKLAELSAGIDAYADNIEIVYERAAQVGLDALHDAKQATIESLNGMKQEYEKFANFTPMKDEAFKVRFEVQDGDSADVIKQKIANLDEYKDKLVGVLNYYKAWAAELQSVPLENDMFGVLTPDSQKTKQDLDFVLSMIGDIESAMDTYASVAGDAYRKAEESGTKSISTVKQVTGEKLKQMQAEYEKYADKVKSLNEEIANREKSLAEQLREMQRSGMDDYSAWKDMKAEAEEYKKAAEEAYQAGNFEQAVQLADKAKSAFERLNTEVKVGDKVVVSQQKALETAMKGVEESGKLAIEALKGQEKAASDAMEALTKESGFANLESGMDDVKKKWLDNWNKMKVNAVNDIKKVEDRLLAIKDKEVTVWINEKVRAAGYAAGGLVGGAFRRIGHGEVNSGGGMRDDVPAMLKRWEFVHPQGAVKKYGYVAMNAIRKLKINPKHLSDLVKGKLPHIPVGINLGSLASMPTLQQPAFNVVGGTGGQSITINLVDEPTGQTIKMSADSQIDVDGLLRILRRKNRYQQ